jgi:arylformamidase
VSDLEREYSPSSRVGGSADPFIDDYQHRSTTAHQGLGPRVMRLPGGSLLVPAAAERAPVLVFVHGGYWQALSAADSLYLAPALHRRGWSYLAVEYTLAPHATLHTMVEQCTAALSELAEALPERGPVVLAGHSAGGHLAAMAALVRPSPIALHRVVLVSGVYDLRPLVHTSVNDVLGLDDAGAAALSPALQPAGGTLGAVVTVEVVVAWGDNETDAFKEQSRAYADRLRADGLLVVHTECAGRHHFDIVDDLTNPVSTLGALTLEA